MRPFLTILPVLLAAASVQAADVDVAVVGSDNRPLAGAVVMVESAARAPGGTISFPWPYVVSQKNISFQPHVLIVPVGAKVAFPNRDTVRHHVYSFSKAKKFELKLYGREEARTVVFETAGVVALGCNIHDSMSGFVVVVDTPFAKEADDSGRVALDGVPGGKAVLRVWHPGIRAPGNQITQSVILGPAPLTRTVKVPS